MVFAELESDSSVDYTSRILNTNGSITTQRDGAAGIMVTGYNWRVTNNADIATGSAIGGAEAYGIAVLAGDSALENTASVNTSGSSAHGIHAVGDQIVLANSGSITTTGPSSFGIHMEGSTNGMVNSGEITATGPVSYGVHASGDVIQIQNSKTITVTNIGSAGVYLASAHQNDGSFGAFRSIRPA